MRINHNSYAMPAVAMTEATTSPGSLFPALRRIIRYQIAVEVIGPLMSKSHPDALIRPSRARWRDTRTTNRPGPPCVIVHTAFLPISL